jgi:hypothetical protein
MSRVAFFGLTAYGPQNALLAAHTDFSMVGAFTHKDFEDAYHKALRESDDGGGGDAAQFLGRVLELVYHGPPPPGDSRRLMQYAPAGANQVTLTELLAVVDAATRDEEAWNEQQRDKVASTAEYAVGSNQQDDRTRHVRAEHGPRTKYTEPVTGSMAIGWEPASFVGVKRAAKKSCAETIFASELIKAGVYY